MTTTLGTFTPRRVTTQFMSARELETHGDFVLSHLAPGMDVLDCGCGPGTITLGLADAVFPGRVTGLDDDPTQIERAARLAEGLELVNASFRTGSAYALPFPDDSLDLVFSHALMEHLSHPADAVCEFDRVLRPGGIAALRSPNWDHFALSPSAPEVQHALDAYRELQDGKGGDTRAGARLERLLEAQGFRILESRTRFEVYPDTREFAEYLALQLEEAEQHRHASMLRSWARTPRASLTGAWTHAVGRKA